MKTRIWTFQGWGALIKSTTSLSTTPTGRSPSLPKLKKQARAQLMPHNILKYGLKFECALWILLCNSRTMMASRDKRRCSITRKTSRGGTSQRWIPACSRKSNRIGNSIWISRLRRWTRIRSWKIREESTTTSSRVRYYKQGQMINYCQMPVFSKELQVMLTQTSTKHI